MIRETSYGSPLVLSGATVGSVAAIVASVCVTVACVTQRLTELFKVDIVSQAPVENDSPRRSRPRPSLEVADGVWLAIPPFRAH
eukprot:SAG22_NODE_430_length_10586_cov_6.817202_3_plen_84_part_00